MRSEPVGQWAERIAEPPQAGNGQCSAASATFAWGRFSICCGSDLRINRGMRWRLIALVSLGVNIALAAAWLWLPRGRAARVPAVALEPISTNQVRTNYLLRRQLFTWQQIESADYPTYIANLREVGCPDQTIRDIIIADVNQLFARRRATELT